MLIDVVLPWFCGASVLLGIGFTVRGWRLVQLTRAFRQTAMSTEGVVKAIQHERSATKSYQYPIIEFVDHQRVTRTFTDKVGSTTGCPQPGTRLGVLYDPTNPEHARIDGFKYLWMFPVLVFVMGLWEIVAPPLVFVIYKLVRR